MTITVRVTFLIYLQFVHFPFCITTLLMDVYFFHPLAHFSNHIIEGKRVHMPSVPDLLNRSPGYHQTGVGSPFSPGAHAPPSPGYLNSPVGCPQTSLGMDHSFPPPPAMFSPSSPFRKGKRSNRAGKKLCHICGNMFMWRKTILFEGLKVQVSFLVDLKIFFFYYPFSWNEKYKWHIIYTFYCYKFEIVMIWLRVQVKLRKIFRSKRWPNNSDWQMMQSNANLKFFLGPFFCVLNTEESF